MTASGISPEISELDTLLEEAILRSKEFGLELEKEAAEKQQKINKDNVEAEDMRQKALETLGETKKRKGQETNSTSKKLRSNGSETVQFLREKWTNEMDILKEELELKSAQQKQQQNMMTQMQDMQMNFMQHRQAQTNLLVSLIDKRTKH